MPNMFFTLSTFETTLIERSAPLSRYEVKPDGVAETYAWPDGGVLPYVSVMFMFAKLEVTSPSSTYENESPVSTSVRLVDKEIKTKLSTDGIYTCSLHFSSCCCICLSHPHRNIRLHTLIRTITTIGCGLQSNNIRGVLNRCNDP